MRIRHLFALAEWLKKRHDTEPVSTGGLVWIVPNIESFDDQP